MSAAIQAATVSRKMFWAGVVVSALPAFVLLMSGVGTLLKPAPLVEEFTRFGWNEDLLLWVGALKITCALIYIYPRTSVLGAILVTGYLGGAIATHVRIADPLVTLIPPVLFGVLVWLGLFLREPRLRAIVPFRS